jgi:hypothetical protein
MVSLCFHNLKNGITVSTTSVLQILPLFPRMKTLLKGCKFQSVEKLKEAAMAALKVTDVCSSTPTGRNV